MHSAVNLCDVGTPRPTARLLRHSTATATGRDPLWQSLKTAATYLVHILTCLGKVSIYENCFFSASSVKWTRLWSIGNKCENLLQCHTIPARGSGNGAVVKTLASLHCGLRSNRHNWVEFVVGSRLCSEGFSPVLWFSTLYMTRMF